MKLLDLGFDDFFSKQTNELCKPKQHIARVMIVNRDRYIIRNEEKELPAKVTGKLLYTNHGTDLPAVGDWVCIEYYDSEESATIHAVLQRKSFLRRKTAGQHIDYQMIASNIDIAFIVQSCHYDFNINRLERYLVMAHEGHVTPLLLLTKTDLISEEELQSLIGRIRHSGITAEIITISNITGEGLDQVKSAMQSAKTYCLIGSSGVGKTTLINQLTQQATYKTNTVSETGEGRHTTVRRQLILLDNGAMLIDTPGMRELGILAATEEVDDSFSDISKLAEQCRFKNCSHVNEPGCGILKAIKSGTLAEKHYQNYLKLKKESEFYEMSYSEKRKKDKAFGRFIQTVQKSKNKYKQQN